MSGPSGRYYRCDACAGTPDRCAACRERRREARTARADDHRARGLCLDCTRDALPGAVRCDVHQRANRDASQRMRDRERRRVHVH